MVYRPNRTGWSNDWIAIGVSGSWHKIDMGYRKKLRLTTKKQLENNMQRPVKGCSSLTCSTFTKSSVWNWDSSRLEKKINSLRRKHHYIDRFQGKLQKPLISDDKEHGFLWISLKPTRWNQLVFSASANMCWDRWNASSWRLIDSPQLMCQMGCEYHGRPTCADRLMFEFSIFLGKKKEKNIWHSPLPYVQASLSAWTHRTSDHSCCQDSLTWRVSSNFGVRKNINLWSREGSFSYN